MAIVNYSKSGYLSDELNFISEWITQTEDISKHRKVVESNDKKTDEASTCKNNLDYILEKLEKKELTGKTSFYFKDKTDYINLYANGHLNAKDGDDGLFKPWGLSEFKSTNPRKVLSELENKITRINLIPAMGTSNYSFDSYCEFINWLTVD